ncbi:MAG: ABC transporter permease [Planctomycetales bacterium]|nr:ABC transporter permease [Planctomycetales bacterium]
MLGLRTWQLGVKSLLLHPLRSLLTVLGIFIGVASVIWLIAISVGISNKAQKQIEDLGATNVIVRSVKPVSTTGDSWFIDYGLKRSDYEVLVETVPTITKALRIRETTGAATYGIRDSIDVRLVGCTPEYAPAMNLQENLGHFVTPAEVETEANHCVLAHAVAKHLFPLEDPLGKTVIVREIPFVVVGVMQPRAAMSGIGGSLAAQDFDRDVYIPITAFWRRIGDTIWIRTSGSRSGEIVELSQVTFQVASTDEVSPTADLIRSTLTARHKQDDFAVTVPLELLEQARATRLMFMVFMGLIAAISLLVGGIGIMNIMLATVTERTREIGIRRAIGAKRRDVVWQFLVETTVLSVVGGVVGIVGGCACPILIDWSQRLLRQTAPKLMASLPDVVTDIQPVVLPESIVVAFVISVTVGVLFGLYPAIRAAKMDPIEALRHE